MVLQASISVAAKRWETRTYPSVDGCILMSEWGIFFSISESLFALWRSISRD
jgi:hypothetical protein